MDPSNGGVEKAEGFGHVFFGFGPFFQCGEFNVHAAYMESEAAAR